MLLHKLTVISHKIDMMILQVARYAKRQHSYLIIILVIIRVGGNFTVFFYINEGWTCQNNGCKTSLCPNNDDQKRNEPKKTKQTKTKN